ncbi:hypothetical protein C6P46_000117 [Rhodotorula mucilaginosa]|uniref:Uncharacterized protein n=1 Tax=Rhodotorula mucilaginosa TaxID=5537 RepID=A0A9P7B9G7_RHOMI|nr:hypothetical protein C6P46_000117 [Rhodotorula mucilaginosa]
MRVAWAQTLLDEAPARTSVASGRPAGQQRRRTLTVEVIEHSDGRLEGAKVPELGRSGQEESTDDSTRKQLVELSTLAHSPSPPAAAASASDNNAESSLEIDIAGSEHVDKTETRVEYGAKVEQPNGKLSTPDLAEPACAHFAGGPRVTTGPLKRTSSPDAANPSAAPSSSPSPFSHVPQKVDAASVSFMRRIKEVRPSRDGLGGGSVAPFTTSTDPASIDTLFRWRKTSMQPIHSAATRAPTPPRALRVEARGETLARARPPVLSPPLARHLGVCDVDQAVLGTVIVPNLVLDTLPYGADHEVPVVAWLGCHACTSSSSRGFHRGRRQKVLPSCRMGRTAPLSRLNSPLLRLGRRPTRPRDRRRRHMSDHCAQTSAPQREDAGGHLTFLVSLLVKNVEVVPFFSRFVVDLRRSRLAHSLI